MLRRFTCVHTLSQGFRILLLPVSCCTTCTTTLLLPLCKTSHWHWYWYTWTIRTRWYSVCGTKERRRNTQIKLCEWPDISMPTTTKTQQSSTQLHVTPQCNHDPPPIPYLIFEKGPYNAPSNNTENPFFGSKLETSTIPAWCCMLVSHNVSLNVETSAAFHFFFFNISVNGGLDGTQRNPTLLSNGFVPGLHGTMPSMHVVSEVEVGFV